MRPYLIVTGFVFALITLAHGVRMVAEGTRVAADPVFILLTVLAAGLSAWAWFLLAKLPRA